MAFKITIPTYEQLSTMMSHLMTNFTNLERNFHKIFFDTTPQNVNLQLYDEDGDLKNYIIPNRAKDFTYILNGEGSPENTISANVGSIYQDTQNGELYIKQFDTGVTGWVKIDPKKSIEKGYVSGDDGPNGYLVREKGALYEDIGTATLYIKTTDTGNDGWVAINADVSGFVNTDLSNLSITGENHFANPSLSNLNQDGENRFNTKQNISNLVTEINDDDNTTYPSEGAVKSYVDAKEQALKSEIYQRANIDLSNLSEVGEAKLSRLIPYVIASGNVDENQQLKLIVPHNGSSGTKYEKYQEEPTENFTFTITTPGEYNVILVGGGGGMGGTYNYQGQGINTFNNGGSGASFEGTITLSAGTYVVTVGEAGKDTGAFPSQTGGNGGDTTLKAEGSSTYLIKARGGKGGGSGLYQGGRGGLLDYDDTVATPVSATTGDGKDGAQTFNEVPSDASYPKYSEHQNPRVTYGRGEGWTTTTGKSIGQKPGYFRIYSTTIYESEGESPQVTYEIKDNKPLTIVTLDGFKKEITAINPDYIGPSGISGSGNYYKFIDDEGSDLFYNINIYKTAYEPVLSETEENILNHIWIKKTEPLEVYKWSGSIDRWSPYKKILLGYYTYNSNTKEFSDIHHARLYDNGFNVTQWQGVVVEFFKQNNSWVRRYSDGWLEQGGIPTSTNIQLLKEFRDENYAVVTGSTSGSITISNKTSGSFSLSSTNCSWIAAGYGKGYVEDV